MVFRFIDNSGQLEKNVIIASGYVGYLPDYFVIRDGVRTTIEGLTGMNWSTLKQTFKLIGFHYD